MLDTQLLAKQVQLTVAIEPLCRLGERAISELLAVVGQQPSYLDRTSFVQGPQDCLGARCRLGRLDLHKCPARGTVYDHKRISS